MAEQEKMDLDESPERGEEQSTQDSGATPTVGIGRDLPRTLRSSTRRRRRSPSPNIARTSRTTTKRRKVREGKQSTQSGEEQPGVSMDQDESSGKEEERASVQDPVTSVPAAKPDLPKTVSELVSLMKSSEKTGSESPSTSKSETPEGGIPPSSIPPLPENLPEDPGAGPSRLPPDNVNALNLRSRHVARSVEKQQNGSSKRSKHLAWRESKMPSSESSCASSWSTMSGNSTRQGSSGNPSVPGSPERQPGERPREERRPGLRHTRSRSWTRSSSARRSRKNSSSLDSAIVDVEGEVSQQSLISATERQILHDKDESNSSSSMPPPASPMTSQEARTTTPAAEPSRSSGLESEEDKETKKDPRMHQE